MQNSDVDHSHGPDWQEAAVSGGEPHIPDTSRTGPSRVGDIQHLSSNGSGSNAFQSSISPDRGSRLIAVTGCVATKGKENSSRQAYSGTKAIECPILLLQLHPPPHAYQRGQPLSPGLLFQARYIRMLGPNLHNKRSSQLMGS